MGPSDMSVVKLNPVDGLPEWKGRKVVTERQRQLAAKRARRFIMVEWGYLVSRLDALRFSRTQRLFLVLLLHRNLQKARAAAGWLILEPKDLIAVGLSDGNLYKSVHQLEALGLIEVQRRPGKRPLLRLIDKSKS
jgi:hypothetical protein